MTLRVFRSDLLRSRACSLIAEIHEWRAEFETPHLEPDYRRHLDDQILFAAQCLAQVLQELARRGQLAAIVIPPGQLGLDLIPSRDDDGEPAGPWDPAGPAQWSSREETLPF